MRKHRFKLNSLFLVFAILANLIIAPAGFAATGIKGDMAKADGRAYVTDELIIKFKPAAAGMKASSLKSRLSLRNVKHMPINDSELVKLDGNISVPEAIQELKKNPDVLYVQPNYIYRKEAAVNDPGFDQLWGLQNSGQMINGITGVAGIDINAPEAWDISMGSSSVTVAVIDEGVNISHPDLAGRIWTNPRETPNNGIDDDGNGLVDDYYGWDFYNNDKTVFDAEDGDLHGTHVAGIIAAAANNAKGIAGVAPNVKIMPLKFLGPDGGDTISAMEAIQYAKANGAKIINASWGNVGTDGALRDAITASGLLFVAAAGNGGDDGTGDNNDVTPVSPASLNSPNIIAVSAVDNQGDLAPFSNYGPTTVDVGAPGVDIYSLKPVYPAMAAALKIYDDVYNYKAVHYGFGLEDLPGDSERAEFMRRALSFLDTDTAAPILVVDDDNDNPDCQPQVMDSLAGYNVVDVIYGGESTDGPTVADMSGKTVVWFTGKATGNLVNWNLTNNDLDNLKTFLDQNGRLLLMGDDIAYGNENDDLFTVYMEERVLSDITPSDTLIDTVYGSTYSLAPSPYRDILVPIGISQSMYNYAASDPVNSYVYESGTSMAAPYVSGVAALMWSVNQNLTVDQVISKIKSTVTTLPSLSGKTAGGGMVNAYQAVLAAKAYAAPQEITGGGGGGGGGITSVASNEFRSTVTADGATVSSEDKSVTVVVPRGAVNIGLPVKLSAKVIAQADVKASIPEGLAIASNIIEFGPGGKVFNKPVKITIKYKPEIAANGDAAPYYLNESKNQWELVPDATVDKNTDTVTFETGHFSKYAIVGRPEVMQYKPFFADVGSHWAKADVEFLAAQGIITGKAGDLFDPDGKVTRAEFARMIAGALGLQPVQGGSAFTDVDKQAWYCQWVEAAYEAGVVAGYDGKFRPDDRITRQEIALMVVKALEIKNISLNNDSRVLDRFTDRARISDWAVAGLAKAVNAGIVHGKSTVIIAPVDDATRAEAAVMVRKLLE